MERVKEGESKIIRYAGKGMVEIELKPTVYSYTFNRCATISGTERIRLQCCEILCGFLKSQGIDHSYESYTSDRIMSRLVYEPGVFHPYDLRPEQIVQLPQFCPIEVVVKDRHVGTPKHRYHAMEKYPTRTGIFIQPGELYPQRMVRFDWRNPNLSPTSERLCDEVMTEEMADLYIDVVAAKNTAILAFKALSKFLSGRDLRLDDICFFISSDGRTIFSEITPDCMRVTSLDEGSLDKDVWRAGGSSPLLTEKWTRFLQLIQ